jgi:hypothetical protein
MDEYQKFRRKGAQEYNLISVLSGGVSFKWNKFASRAPESLI